MHVWRYCSRPVGGTTTPHNTRCTTLSQFNRLHIVCQLPVHLFNCPTVHLSVTTRRKDSRCSIIPLQWMPRFRSNSGIRVSSLINPCGAQLHPVGVATQTCTPGSPLRTGGMRSAERGRGGKEGGFPPQGSSGADRGRPCWASQRLSVQDGKHGNDAMSV